MATVLPHTINLRGDSIPRNEALADEAITPGMLLERTATGVKKNTVAGTIPWLVAVEEELLNPSGIDTDYAIGALVNFWGAQPGDWAYLLCADGSVIAKGARLIPATGGLVAAGTTAGFVVGTCIEAVDYSASAHTGLGRIKVEFGN